MKFHQSLIHKESDITIRAIRDYLKEDIQEIIIDDAEAYQDLKRQLTVLRPHFVERLQIYSKDTPLFSSHHIEKQIESAFKRRAGQKDSGNMIPGLGGIFDLSDSIILIAPLAYLLIKYFIF